MPDISRLTKQSFPRFMDYSILSKDTQESEIRKGCADVRKYRFAAFYTSSAYWTPIVAEELAGYDDIEIGVGIAFPFGSAPPSVKAFEMEHALAQGCTTLDLTMNIGALKDGRLDVVREELRHLAEICGESNVSKCILDVGFLSDEEIATGCKLIAEAGVDFAKTSSGQFEGPTLEQFLVMRRTLADSDVRLKVAGVKFPRPQNALAFVLAGAERIGTRAAVEIVEAWDALEEAGLVPVTVTQELTTEQ